MKLFAVILLLASSVIFNSCGDDTVILLLEDETVLFEKSGLVDSAVVYGCYPRTISYYIPDTLDLNSFSRVKVMFDGFANSDGCSISILYNTADSTNVTTYYVEDALGVNKIHTTEFLKPANQTWLELRLYINPPVCGTNEFKYTRARDLKIYGIK